MNHEQVLNPLVFIFLEQNFDLLYLKDKHTNFLLNIQMFKTK